MAQQKRKLRPVPPSDAGSQRKLSKERRFSKTDLGKYTIAWNALPHFVSFGNQKNFQFFTQSLKDEFPDGFEPDEEWYRSFRAKAILFRSVHKLVRTAKFPAYQATFGQSSSCSDTRRLRAQFVISASRSTTRSRLRRRSISDF